MASAPRAPLVSSAFFSSIDSLGPFAYIFCHGGVDAFVRAAAWLCSALSDPLFFPAPLRRLLCRQFSVWRRCPRPSPWPRSQYSPLLPSSSQPPSSLQFSLALAAFIKYPLPFFPTVIVIGVFAIFLHLFLLLFCCGSQHRWLFFQVCSWLDFHPSSFGCPCGRCLVCSCLRGSCQRDRRVLLHSATALNAFVLCALRSFQTPRDVKCLDFAHLSLCSFSRRIALLRLDVRGALHFCPCRQCNVFPSRSCLAKRKNWWFVRAVCALALVSVVFSCFVASRLCLPASLSSPRLCLPAICLPADLSSRGFVFPRLALSSRGFVLPRLCLSAALSPRGFVFTRPCLLAALSSRGFVFSRLCLPAALPYRDLVASWSRSFAASRRRAACFFVGPSVARPAVSELCGAAASRFCDPASWQPMHCCFSALTE